eukprot:scaffold31203_cov32-Tisochrysis_lutea.AAC.1
MMLQLPSFSSSLHSSSLAAARAACARRSEHDSHACITLCHTGGAAAYNCRKGKAARGRTERRGAIGRGDGIEWGRSVEGVCVRDDLAASSFFSRTHQGRIDPRWPPMAHRGDWQRQVYPPAADPIARGKSSAT